MYKIIFYNDKNEEVLVKTYKTVKELFEASLNLQTDTLHEIIAFSAVASIGDTILLRTSVDDLVFEYNIIAFQTIPKLYDLLLASKRFVPEESWIKVPTKEELIAYQDANEKQYLLLGGGWISFKTKDYEWTIDDDGGRDIQRLLYSKTIPDLIHYSDSLGDIHVAFKLDDFVSSQVAISYNGSYIWLVEYK